MNFKRFICILLCLALMPLFVPTVSAKENTEIYLESSLVFENTVRVSLGVRGNFGFCGGFFVLSYNKNQLLYSFCVSEELPPQMSFSSISSDDGKVYILLDSTKNFYSDSYLAHFYFEIFDENVDVLKFDISGADEISLARIEDGGAVAVECSYFGDSLTLNYLPRIVGFQYGKDKIRIVGAGNEKYDVLGIEIRAVYPNAGKIEAYVCYGYAYKSLNGTDKIPADYDAKYFFLGECKTDSNLICLFVRPMGYDGEKIIYGKEKTLLFYKGEYI